MANKSLALSNIFFFKLIPFYLFCFLAIVTSALEAYQFSGNLIKNNSQYYLKINSSLIYPIDTIYPIISAQLKELNTNDYISFNGHMYNSLSDTKILIDSIDFVGLEILIGVWKSYNGQCFYFKNYTTFTIKNIDKNNNCPPIEKHINKTYFSKTNPFEFILNPLELILDLQFKVQSLINLNPFRISAPFRDNRIFKANKTYTYLINPDTEMWNVLINSEDQSFIGELKIIDETKIKLQLFDSQNDNNLGVITLKKQINF